MTDWREAVGTIWAYVADVWAYVADLFSTPERVTALFTAVLAVSTIFLWLSTRRLWRVTRIAAEHIPHVERAYVSGGATGVASSPEHFAVTVDNYGKTPAFIGTIWANIVPENELPDTPVYDPPGLGQFGGQNIETWHVRSFHCNSPLGYDRGPCDLRPNLVSRHFQTMPFGWLHFAHFGPRPNYRCRKSRCVLGRPR
jgi:hypothetical protein